MTDRVTIKWDPDPPFSKQLAKLKRPRSLFRSYEGIMMALKNQTHLKAGLAPRWKKSKAAQKRQGRTGYRTGTLAQGWRRGSTSRMAKIVNPTAYANDFYRGHPARNKAVPAHQRRLKSGKFVSVRAHTRRERAQPKRDIVWTSKYMKKAIQVTGKFVLK